MRITLLFMLLLCGKISIDAQDNPSLYAYVHNPIVIAPSFAGINSGTLSVLSDYRFIGIEGSPRTSISSFEYMLVESGLGLAVSWTADKIGPIQNNSLHVSTAYHLQISRDEYFSFGMRHGLHTFLMNLNNERYIDLADISINTGVYNTAYYNLDLSGLYYSKENYFGATLFNAVNGQFLIDNYTARSLGFFGGGEYQYNRNIKVSYSGALLATAGKPVVLNLYAQYFIRPELRVGLQRHDRDYGFNAVFENRGLKLFYKYSYPSSMLRFFSSQSHTFGFSYDFINEKRRVESPVFFLN
jgi:type IX secretion system PorP/SprF family membrane protein